MKPRTPNIRATLWPWAVCLCAALAAPAHAVPRSSFGNTYYWGGLEGVFDASGQPLSGVILSTDSGFDLVTVSAVPEPGNWALWLGGLAVMGHLLRRRAASLT